MSTRIARRSDASVAEIATCSLIGWSPCLLFRARQERLFEDGSWFEKRLDPECSEFTADAGMLEPAERRLLIVQHSVDRYAAGLDLRRDAACALNVRAAHVSVEAVLRIVGDLYCILFVLVSDDREDGPEN